MNKQNTNKIWLRIVLILVVIFILWFWQLDEDHSLKSRLKTIIKAIS